MATRDDIKRYRDFLREEVDGLYIYEQLAQIETDPQLQDIYRRLATTEARHLALWQGQLRDAGEEPGDVRPSTRARALMWLATSGRASR